jgi:hypothetical protein
MNEQAAGKIKNRGYCAASAGEGRFMLKMVTAAIATAAAPKIGDGGAVASTGGQRAT